MLLGWPGLVEFAVMRLVGFAGVAGYVQSKGASIAVSVIRGRARITGVLARLYASAWVVPHNACKSTSYNDILLITYSLPGNVG